MLFYSFKCFVYFYKCSIYLYILYIFLKIDVQVASFRVRHVKY